MSGSRVFGAVAGSLIAGIGITALLMAGERKSNRPSELADLERAAEAKLGLRVRDHGALPGPGEQAVIQGGHLLLSVAAGATYAAVTDEDADVLSSGILFGLSFYAAMHWIVGPLLWVKKPEWQADTATIGMHTANHLLLGLATATAPGSSAVADACRRHASTLPKRKE